MTRVNTASDTVTEPGRSYAYFLGASIPTGIQTISMSYNTGTVESGHAVCCTQTAGADTAVAVSGVAQENQANPQIVLDSGADSALRYCHIYSGLVGPASLTILSGMTAIHNHDFGPACDLTDRQTSPSTGSFTIGYTAASDDVAMVAFAIKEVTAVAGSAVRPIDMPLTIWFKQEVIGY